MLLATIGLWSLNLTVSRYILTHGLQPLAYGSVRYVLAALVFCGITLVAERSLRVAPRDLVLRWARPGPLRQPGRVRLRAPRVDGLRARAAARRDADLRRDRRRPLGTETLPRRFWAGALLSFAGVALVALGARDEVSGGLVGVLLGVLAAASWAAYSMLITPLMRRYSASRIPTIVLAATCVPLTLTALPQLSTRTGASAGRSGCSSCSPRSGLSSRRT